MYNNKSMEMLVFHILNNVIANRPQLPSPTQAILIYNAQWAM